jgi:hypothetical protein
MAWLDAVRLAGAAWRAAGFSGLVPGCPLQVVLAHEPDEDAVGAVVPGNPGNHGHILDCGRPLIGGRRALTGRVWFGCGLALPRRSRFLLLAPVCGLAVIRRLTRRCLLACAGRLAGAAGLARTGRLAGTG